MDLNLGWAHAPVATPRIQILFELITKVYVNLNIETLHSYSYHVQLLVQNRSY
jgi:hypothetical protein